MARPTDDMKKVLLYLPLPLWDRLQASRVRRESQTDQEALREVIRRGLDAAEQAEVAPRAIRRLSEVD